MDRLWNQQKPVDYQQQENYCHLDSEKAKGESRVPRAQQQLELWKKGTRQERGHAGTLPLSAVGWGADRQQRE